jgi:signal transduction histidine kinase
MLKMQDQIVALSPSLETHKFYRMLTWEGATFFMLIVLLGATLVFFYVKDLKLSKSLQTFFASLTHELKTPLASIRLQSEVLNEIIKNPNHDHAYLEELGHRLIEGTQTLEHQLDQLLQLSRIERGSEIDLTAIEINDFLNRFTRRNYQNFNLEFKSEGNEVVLGNILALEMIFRNLIENTMRHGKEKVAKLTLLKNDNHISLTYEDQGKFNGDINKLGELFYQHQSQRGSGVGLYLIKNLMKKMHGELKIKTTTNGGLQFHLTFRQSV